MVLDMTKNSQILPSQVFGPIIDGYRAAGEHRSGRSGAGVFHGKSRCRVPDTLPRVGLQLAHLVYRLPNWSQTSLDTTLGTLRAAGLQGQQLQSEQAVLDRLRVMAQSSDGRMQALQVANQIAEQQVQQTMKLRQLMLADLQSKQAFQAAQMQRQAATEAASEQFFTFGGRTGDGRGYQAAQ